MGAGHSPKCVAPLTSLTSRVLEVRLDSVPGFRNEPDKLRLVDWYLLRFWD